MSITTLKKSEGLLGFAIVSSVLAICVVGVMFFSAYNPDIIINYVASETKYPAKAFVLRRQGPLKSKTKYTGIATGNGMSVDVKFDQADQQLMLKIKDRTGKPMPRVTVDARASRVGQAQTQRNVAMKEYSGGEYRSDPMGLEKGGWVLTVTAYDLLRRGENKLLFHTEKPVFLK